MTKPTATTESRSSFVGYSCAHDACTNQKERHEEWLQEFEKDEDDYNPSAYDEDGITLINSELMVEHEDELAGKMLALRGVFMRRYMDGKQVDLDACGSAALIVDEADVRRLLQPSQ
jgi:hypothetical protein